MSISRLLGFEIGRLVPKEVVEVAFSNSLLSGAMSLRFQNLDLEASPVLVDLLPEAIMPASFLNITETFFET